MKKCHLLPATLLIAALAILIWICYSCSSPHYSDMVQVHFVGTDMIAGDTNSAAFNVEFSSPEARALESQSLDKLSRAPGVWFKDKLPTGAGDGSAQLRPLLDDFLKSEWLFEMRGAPDATLSPEYALAIRLDDARAQLWLTIFQSLLQSWTKINVQPISGGWELKKDLPPNLFRIVRAGQWIVIGCGQNHLPLSDAWAKDGPSPEDETNWVNANVDWPRLAQFFPVFGKFNLPATKMQVVGRKGVLQATGNLELSQPLPALEAWQIPTNMIHPPLTSFTAVRGFAPWLENQPWSKLWQLSPEPDQAFIWSLGASALQTFLAVPVADATNALAQLGDNLTDNTNWQNGLISHLGIDRTPKRISFSNVPFVSPEVSALTKGPENYLFADVFPNTPHGKMPAPLLDALGRDNLVFYHWEITSQRLKDLPQLTQLTMLVTQHRQLDPGSAAGKWLTRIGASLGDSVTEVTQITPTELAFTRTSSSGLTAIELIALANWLETPNFPGCDLSLPPPLPNVHHHKPRKIKGQAAQPLHPAH